MKDNPNKIIDIATGTGDIALCFANKGVDVVGVDNASMMLDLANKKKGSISNIKFKLEDAENMSFEDNTFDVATVGFGVRNFENLKKSLDEIHRVLKENGTLIILETSVPTNCIIKIVYNIFTKIYVRLIGRVFSKNYKAYSYLQQSASNFPYGKEFIKILKNSNFINPSQDIKLFGASTIYVAKK